MGGPEGVIAVLTGLVTSVLALGIVFWAIYWGHQKRRLQYQERQLMIEKGMTPPQVMPDERKRVTPEDCLRRGLVLLFLGVGFGVGAIVLSRPGVEGPPAWLVAVPGAVVGFLGLGYLAYYFIARRGTRESPERTGMPM